MSDQGRDPSKKQKYGQVHAGQATTRGQLVNNGSANSPKIVMRPPAPKGSGGSQNTTLSSANQPNDGNNSGNSQK